MLAGPCERRRGAAGRVVIAPAELPDDLPPPVRRHLEAVGVRAPARAEAGGPGSIHQALAGRAGVWLPLAWRVEVVPGEEYRFEAKVRPLGLRVGRLREELVRGHGRVVVGRRSFERDDVDRAQAVLVWLWTLLLAPGAALRRADVTWEARGQAEARLLFPLRHELLEATLGFDREAGLLDRFETMRFELRAGHPRPWTARLAGYRDLGSLRVPSTVVAHWSGEPALRLRLERAAAA